MPAAPSPPAPLRGAPPHRHARSVGTAGVAHHRHQGLRRTVHVEPCADGPTVQGRHKVLPKPTSRAPNASVRQTPRIRLSGVKLNSPLSASAGLNPPDFSANEPKMDLADVARFMLISSTFLALGAQCGIASHARGRWFKPSRAHQEPPKCVRLDSPSPLGCLEAAEREHLQKSANWPLRHSEVECLTRWTSRAREPCRETAGAPEGESGARVSNLRKLIRRGSVYYEVSDVRRLNCCPCRCAIASARRALSRPSRGYISAGG